ncbi:MAG: Ni/Fe hydrogenase subunit alpha [Nitrospiraceae bacterium]|nr:Ni/Fe hydrogenase subunit alpha [Nitrospiraceae bacterium]
MKRVFSIGYLSRVEGEAGITAEILDGKAVVRARVFEAPRFFEAFLRGRHFSDVADFTARICGICPVAYQMSSVHAMESIFGVEVEEPIRQLRRLLYCGEWIESHSLHIYMLQGPDFYGCESAWSDRQYLPLARRGLSFKKLGNQIMTILGGRPIHPVSVKAGGFFKIPDKKTLSGLLPDIERAYEQTLEAVSWAASLPFNDNDWDWECLSLRGPNEYPMNYGNVSSNKGAEKPMADFLEDVREYQVAYSTALHAEIKTEGPRPYLVGPVARLNLNHDLLPPEIKAAIRQCGIRLPMTNTHMGIIARSIELAYAFHEAVRIIKTYEMPGRPSACFEPRAGQAVWITEAPRGMLIHHYEIDGEGLVKRCAIIPPTSQNLGHMEKDLNHFMQMHMGEPANVLRKECEKIIRSYDPCISCSVH